MILAVAVTFVIVTGEGSVKKLIKRYRNAKLKQSLSLRRTINLFELNATYTRHAVTPAHKL